MKRKSRFLFLILAGICQGFNWIFLFEAYVTTAKICGFFVVFTGMILVNGEIFLEGNSMWGVFCGMMGAVFYAGINITNKFATEIDAQKTQLFCFYVLQLQFFAI